MTDRKNIYETIMSVLSGEASHEERSLLEKWLIESDENKKEFDKVKQVYDRSGYGSAILHVDRACSR